MSGEKSVTRSKQSSSKLGARPIGSIKRATSCVIYGPSGSGKTTFSASAPKKMLYLNVNDEGMDSIADVEGIDVKDVPEFEEFEDTYWWLEKHPDAYKTVVVDTVSQLQTLAVQEIGKGKKRKGAFAHKKLGDFGTMTKQDWGTVSSLMKEWLTNYRDLTHLGMHVIFIAQHRTFNVGDDGDASELAPEVGPALSPSIAQHLNASVNVIGNTFIRERTKVNKETKKKTKIIEYCLGVGPSSLYVRKVRKPKSMMLPDVIVDPEFGDITDIIKGRN